MVVNLKGQQILCAIKKADINYLPPVAEGRGWEIINAFRMLVCACVHLPVHLSHFYINLNISFIYKDIFTKFAGNVYCYENMSVKNFGLILKNKMAAIANYF